MKDIVKLSIILMVFCVVSAFALSMTNNATIGIIKESRAAKDVENRKAVFADAEEFEAISEDLMKEIQQDVPTIAEIFKAQKDGAVVGFVAKTIPGGFGGPVEVIVGFDTEGTIVGVRVGKHSETPGLGDKSTEPEFYEQYNEMTLTKPIVVDKIEKGDNQILAISAATITSRAVTSGVNDVGKVIERLQDEIK